MTSAPVPPRSSRTSIWPAATVLLTAVGLLVIFSLLNLATNTATTTSTAPAAIVVGGLPVQTGTGSGSLLLGDCRQSGTPPDDIVSAYLLPRPSRPDGAFKIVNAGAGDFDCHRSFLTLKPPAYILGFYQNQLAARGWSLFSTGAANGAPQDLFQRAGSDTFYWEIGITVNKVAHGQTSWTYRIFQSSTAV